MGRTKSTARKSKRNRDSLEGGGGGESSSENNSSSRRSRSSSGGGGRRSRRRNHFDDEEAAYAAAAAEAAAASAANDNDGDGEQDQEEEDEEEEEQLDGILGVLVGMLKRNTGRNGSMENPEDVDGPDNNNDDDGDDDEKEEIEIDTQKAKNCLEASAGNLALAAHLFWDDYHATNHHLHHNRNININNNNDDDAKAQKKRRTSRRHRHRHEGDGQQGGGKPAPKNNNDDGGDDDTTDGDDNDGSSRRASKRTRRSSRNRRSRGGGDDADYPDDAELEARLEESILADIHAAEAEAFMEDDSDNGLISDDDAAAHRAAVAGRSLRNRRSRGNPPAAQKSRSGRKSRQHHQLSGEKRARQKQQQQNMAAMSAERSRQIKEAAEAIARDLLSKKQRDGSNGIVDPVDSKIQRRREEEKKKEEEENDDSNDNPNDFIADEDWLGDEAGPMIVKHILWNYSVPGSSDENENELEESLQSIPRTWLSAAFQLSDCTTGLTANSPDIDAIETMAWKMNRDSELRTQWPNPYHCKSLTSILSIVTALLYTGASIQDDEVKCTTGRTPWADLSPESRKRQFEGRLADALSSLIFIAAKASLRRKQNSFRKVQKENKKKGKDLTEDDTIHERRMQTRLNLIPVCSWDEQAELPTDPRGPGEALCEEVLIKTSLTNIKQIRHYVVSTMRSFTAPGGVALFIETILRIHGSVFVAKNLEAARMEYNKVMKEKSSVLDAIHCRNPQQGLIECTCDQRLRMKNKGKLLPASVRNDPIKLVDLTPPGTECVSVELLTLLLTGQIQSSLDKCDSGGLGFGMLTDHIGEVSPALSRPEKPVWVVRGPTCYSVLCIKKIVGNDDVDFRTISKVDEPGSTLDLVHWNAWYTGRDKSEVRVKTASREWSPPSQVSKLGLWDRQNAGGPLFEVDARRAKLINNISIQQEDSNVSKEKKEEVTRDDLRRVMFHPEDEKLYHGKFRMWRYKFLEKVDSVHSPKVQGKEDRNLHGVQESSWKHFFRLSEREKKIIELKMGPKISAIISTRWPGAKIDIISEVEGLPIV